MVLEKKKPTAAQRRRLGAYLRKSTFYPYLSGIQNLKDSLQRFKEFRKQNYGGFEQVGLAKELKSLSKLIHWV